MELKAQISAWGWAEPSWRNPGLCLLPAPWRPPWLQQEFPGARGFIPSPGAAPCPLQPLRLHLALCFHSEMGEDRAADVAPREGLQPGQFLGQDTPHPTRITLQDPFFSYPGWLQGALPVRASLLTAFICRKISSFMAAKFSRLVEMTSLIVSSSLLMKGNRETALFRVEQWWSKVVLQDRKYTRCIVYIIYNLYWFNILS